MERRIEVRIDKNGNLETDFSGFNNRDCEKEEERLRMLLKKFGVTVNIKQTFPKSIDNRVIENNAVRNEIR